MCALEVLAHSAGLPANMIVTKITIPKGVAVQKIDEADLPAYWSEPAVNRKTQHIGTDWAASGATAVPVSAIRRSSE